MTGPQMASSRRICSHQGSIARSGEALLHALLAWRTETQDVQWLRENTHRGGPVARNVADHTRRLGGNDAERRLGHRLTSIEFERACATVA